MNKNYANTIVAFHRRNGVVSYKGEKDASYISQDLLYPKKKNGEDILSGNKEMTDLWGNEVGATVSEYNKGVGYYEFDGDYDSWSFVKLKDLDEDRKRLILEENNTDYHYFFENEKMKKKLINQLKKEIKYYVNSKEITEEDIKDFFDERYIVDFNTLLDPFEKILWSRYNEIFDELVDLLVTY